MPVYHVGGQITVWGGLAFLFPKMIYISIGTEMNQLGFLEKVANRGFQKKPE